MSTVSSRQESEANTSSGLGLRTQGFSFSLPLALLSVCYFLAAILWASNAPLDTDEVFVLFTVRDVETSRLYDVLKAGSDTLPPGFYWLLKGIAVLFGTSPLALRVPSIIGFYAFLAAGYLLCRRFASRTVSSASVALLCLTQSADFIVVARPYTILAACFGASAFIWSKSLDDKQFRRSQLLVGLPIAIGGMVHFYAVFIAVAIGLAEVAWTFLNRQTRLRIWLSLVVGTAAILIWLPLIAPIYHLTQSSVAAPAFYARPTFSALFQRYAELFLKPSLVWGSLLALYLIIWEALRPSHSANQESAARPRMPFECAAAALAALALPLITFAFTSLVTHSFNARYFIAAPLGVVIIAAFLLSQSAGERRICTVLCCSCLLLFTGSAMIRQPDPRLELLAKTPESLPIVVGDASDFFELIESSPVKIRQRLAFVGMPAGLQSPDPEPQMLAEKWAAQLPGLAVFRGDEFLAGSPRFYLLCTQSPREGLTDWLRLHGQLTVVDRSQHEWLFLAETRATGYGKARYPDASPTNTTLLQPSITDRSRPSGQRAERSPLE